VQGGEPAAHAEHEHGDQDLKGDRYSPDQAEEPIGGRWVP